MKNLILLIAIALFAVVPSTYGQSASETASFGPSDTYQLGDRKVRVPAPKGFVDVSKTFEKVGARMRATQGSGNEMLETFVPATFVPRLRQSQDIDLEFYATLAVVSKLKNTDLTNEDFAATVSDLEKNFNTYLDPNGPIMKRVENTSEKNLTALLGSDTNVDFTGTKSLGFFEKNDKVFSGMMLANIEINGRKISTLGTFSALNTGKRLIVVYAFKMFPKSSDVPMLRDFAKQWTAAIVAANK